jgi:hypothetical protein
MAAPGAEWADNKKIDPELVKGECLAEINLPQLSVVFH